MAISSVEEQKYLNVDEVVIKNSINNNNVYLIKFIKLLNPSRIARSRLCFQIGFLVMLLKNISPLQGLHNRIKLDITWLMDWVLRARILRGQFPKNLVFIPQITVTLLIKELLFILKRKKFLICIAFKRTINKFQRQLMKHIGLNLEGVIYFFFP